MFNPWRLSGTEAVLQKIVFEIKYFYGMTYLDRCGKTVNAIMSNYPEWTLAGDQPNPQAAPLVSLDNAARFHFGTKKLDMSLERRIGDDGLTVSEVDKFAIQSEAVSAEVISQLGLNVFSRIGLRAWFVFANDSSEATEKWLNALGCYSTSQ